MRMPLMDCRHKPACGIDASRWKCNQRTAIESAVNRGLITREAGHSLLQKYQVPMTPMSKVYTGRNEPREEQGRLV